MPKSLRDLIYQSEELRTDLRDAGLFAAAGYLEQVQDAIRNRQAYDDAEGDETNAER